MMDRVSMIALTRPDTQRDLADAWLAGFEAGYDLARAQLSGPRAAGGRRESTPTGENQPSDERKRFSTEGSDDGRTA